MFEMGENHNIRNNDGGKLGVVMGYKLYTANFKGRIGLGSGLILIHF
jgi:hypothetical protein